MKLHCYALAPEPLPLKPAAPDRPWMDEIPEGHAYRCLPLSIANAHGWEIGSPCDFEVAWNGGPQANALLVRAIDGFPNLHHYAVSHFAFGIVTFHLTWLFRTEPGWNLVATGPLNAVKDGIAPLTGVIETDWLPYPFTMNWKMTRPGRVQFRRGEPLCMVYPVAAGAVTQCQPEIHHLQDNPALEAEAMAWRSRRDEFMKRFRDRDPATLKEGWQRFYFLGKSPEGSAAPTGHVHKLRAPSPVDRRGERIETPRPVLAPEQAG
ncbi:MAG TPA: DUF6065 family protein [Casimicrobiaceae bacterium]|nr:DUF6065 family protein [Casimicrobiaceae bacterium]